LPINPLAKTFNPDLIYNDDEKKWSLPTEEIKRKVEKYREELEALPKSEIKTRYGEEFAKKRLEDDQRRFFNQPSANADYDYWSKMAHWTLDEAIALSFGKNPKVVYPGRLSNFPSYTSPFVEEFEKLKELTERAHTWKKLYDPVLPIIFVKWTTDMDIPFSLELANKVREKAKNFVDWKIKYDALWEETKTSIEKLIASSEDSNQTIKKLNEILELKDQKITELETSQPQAKPLHTKEQETLLKMIVGMAVGGYAYDPNASRTSTAKEISDDLLRLGLSLDQDTVRKWLKEATSHYPPEIEDLDI
jgi:hypothetical protein